MPYVVRLVACIHTLTRYCPKPLMIFLFVSTTWELCSLVLRYQFPGTCIYDLFVLFAIDYPPHVSFPRLGHLSKEAHIPRTCQYRHLEQE